MHVKTVTEAPFNDRKTGRRVCFRNVGGRRVVQQEHLSAEDEHGSSPQPRGADASVPDIILGP